MPPLRRDTQPGLVGTLTLTSQQNCQTRRVVGRSNEWSVVGGRPPRWIDNGVAVSRLQPVLGTVGLQPSRGTKPTLRTERSHT